MSAVPRGLVLALALLAGACGSPPAIYTLGTTAGPAAAPMSAPVAAPSGRSVLIHVDRPTVAATFDRTEMVTRSGPFGVTLQNRTVWSEPIAELMARALVDDLARRFGDDAVMATPRARNPAPDWRVELDVFRFEVEEGGGAVLDARWTLIGADDRMAARRRERIVAPTVDQADATSRVTALREALAILAGRIGDAIVGGGGGGPGTERAGRRARS